MHLTIRSPMNVYLGTPTASTAHAINTRAFLRTNRTLLTRASPARTAGQDGEEQDVDEEHEAQHHHRCGPAQPKETAQRETAAAPRGQGGGSERTRRWFLAADGRVAKEARRTRSEAPMGLRSHRDGHAGGVRTAVAASLWFREDGTKETAHAGGVRTAVASSLWLCRT